MFDPQMYPIQVALSQLGVLGEEHVTGFYSPETAEALEALGLNGSYVSVDSINTIVKAIKEQEAPETKTVKAPVVHSAPAREPDTISVAPEPTTWEIAEGLWRAFWHGGYDSARDARMAEGANTYAEAKVAEHESKNPADYVGGELQDAGLRILKVSNKLKVNKATMGNIKQGIRVFLTKYPDHKLDAAYILAEKKGVYKIKLKNSSNGESLTCYVSVSGGYQPLASKASWNNNQLVVANGGWTASYINDATGF